MLPLVGQLDEGRSATVTERLLGELHRAGARCVIIDITGIDAVDSMTASLFRSMVKAARLLGAFVVMS